MKTITVFAAILALATAQVPMYRNVPVLPQHTAFEWDEIMANQLLPPEEDFDATEPAGIESQPETSGFTTAPPEGKIVNGNVAYPGQFPWQAAITMDGKSFCGGSLISKTVVLTAAHCVYSYSEFTVSLGAHFIRQPERTRVQRATRDAVHHDRYNDRYLVNDIAVLIFHAEFPLSDRINTIALPTRSMISELFEKEAATVSGWGRRDRSNDISPVLNFVRVRVIPNSKCAHYFGWYIHATNICGDGSLGRSACNGDSGGPFSVKKNGKETVVGIVSFGNPEGCDLGYPSVYTRVTSYLPWIQKHTGIKITQ